MRNAALALALALVLAAPALASDFYTPSPVPSSRDGLKANSGTKKSGSLRNLSAGNKIVKSTKPGAQNATATAPRKPASIQ